jgi:hypothetical protein
MEKKNKVQVSEMNPRRTGAVAAVKANFGKPYLSWESLVKFEDVSPFILTHLQHVQFSLLFSFVFLFIFRVLTLALIVADKL